MVPWSQLRQPFSGWVMTVRTTEFTNFKLVIHLSKLQQPAILFFLPFEFVPLILRSQGFLADAFLQLRSRSELPETSVFAATFAASYCIISRPMIRQAHDFQVWYSFLLVLWWGETYCASNSLELESCFMPLRHDLTTVPVQGIIARFCR